MLSGNLIYSVETAHVLIYVTQPHCLAFKSICHLLVIFKCKKHVYSGKISRFNI